MFTNSESLMVALLIISILIDGVVSFNMSQRYLFQGQLAVAIIEKQDISRAITQVAPFTPLRHIHIRPQPWLGQRTGTSLR